MVRLLRQTLTNLAQFRIDDGPMWCEFSVWDLDTDDAHIGSFGGSTWLFSWPDLFVVHPNTVHGQSTTLTPLGLAMVRAAKEAA